jgi:crotonobetaine/carnitine-CoA ligase
MLTFPHFTPHFPKSMWTLPQILEHQARTAAERQFLQWTDRNPPLSYAETNRRANQLAHGLAALGVRKGDRVVIFMQNHLDFVLAWFGISKLGAVEAPINTAYRGSFLEHQVKICGAETAIVAEELLDRVQASIDKMPGLKRVIVWSPGGRAASLPQVGNCKVTHFADLFAANDANPGVAVAPNDLASILYTSGTTGLSKGVLMPHAQTYFFAEEFSQMMKLTVEDTYHTAFPFFHANAQFLSIYPTMICGGRVVMYERFSATEWIHQINDSGATAVNSIGVTLPFVFAQPPSPRDRTHKLKKIYSVPTPFDTLDALRERFGPLEFMEAYGQTEICHPFQTPMELNAKRPKGAAGLLVDQWYDVRVVDMETDQEVPEGQIGELVVRHKEPWTLNAGYSNMPEKTLEAYRNLWFHTGDGVKRDKDGWFYFVDRIKDALRRRGENISSFEVEEPIREHPAVADIAVVAAPSGVEGGEDELKACVVLKPGARFSPEELIAWCDQRMPYFCVPRYVEYLDELPKTPTAKIQKVKLRETSIAGAWDRVKAGYKLRDELERERKKRAKP